MITSFNENADFEFSFAGTKVSTAMIKYCQVVGNVVLEHGMADLYVNCLGFQLGV
jgi:hypothetical protein